MDGNISLAKVVLISKDEGHLIHDFIEYYGALFGLSNIVVVDNGSRCPRVLEVYESYISLGVKVIHDPRPFSNATSFMSEHMRAMAPSCTWLLPLETDEFIFVIPKKDQSEYSTNAEDVQAYLRSIPEDVSIVNYGEFWGSVVDPCDTLYDTELGLYHRPATDITRFINQGWDKVIVRSSEFTHMQQWCHHANVCNGKKIKSEFLGLLHFHNTGFRRIIDSSVRVLKTFPYIKDIKEIGEYMGVEEARRTHWVCRETISMGVACGHKLEYYDRYLRRLLTLFAFRDVLGRLPMGPEELDSIADTATDPEHAVIKKFRCPPPPGELEETAASKWSWDSLLFHDNSPIALANTIHYVPHVRNFFESPIPPTTFEIALNKYASLNNTTGTDKTTSHAYGPLYTSLFGGMRERVGGVKTILEIGVFSGASVQAFADFFPEAAVVGMDITLDNIIFGRKDPRVTYIKGDGTNPIIAECLGIHFDIILDDASHMPDDQVNALDAFASFIKPGGIFVIEDIAGNKDIADLRVRLDKVAERHGLVPGEWFDLRSVNGQFDDIVAVFRRKTNAHLQLGA
jgi:SAM-dependent methyltransferase